MEKSHYQLGDTIAAVASAPGEGGVAVIRVSGPSAIQIVSGLYDGPLSEYLTHTLHLGLLKQEGSVLDQVMVAVMKAPKSYTGEEVVEIYCHGGSLITRKILAALMKVGARAALPGEFTFRSFMNGKMDLSQAEAVQSLIGAKNELALKAAEEQLKGRLSQVISSLQKELVEIAAVLEAWVDFPEEGLEFTSMSELLETLEMIYHRVDRLVSSFTEGRLLEEGVSLSLVGAPNAGKSSLMNALLGYERAIVTPIPGTTRDLLEASMKLDNLHIHLVDTAGIRESDDLVEQEGVRRAKESMNRADLILFVVDGTEGISSFAEIPKEDRVLIVWNKRDLPNCLPPPKGAVVISAEREEGLDDLRRAIQEKVWTGSLFSKDEVVITQLRHKEVLGGVLQSLTALMNGLRAKVSPEFCVLDLRAALQGLASIVGGEVTEEVLSAIFSKFCVGK